MDVVEFLKPAVREVWDALAYVAPVLLLLLGIVVVAAVVGQLLRSWRI